MKLLLKYYTMKPIRRNTLLEHLDHFINSIYKFNSDFIIYKKGGYMVISEQRSIIKILYFVFTINNCDISLFRYV